MIIQQIIFAIISLSAIWLTYRRFMTMRRNILLGNNEEIGGQEGKRRQIPADRDKWAVGRIFARY